MKERPLLMTGAMVRAYMAGRKTQTRRVFTGWREFHACLTGDCPHQTQDECHAAILADCPYGQRGDRLWLRETWRPASIEHPRVRIEYRADGSSWGNADTEAGPDQKVLPGNMRPFSKDPWKPSIFMPRWACRHVVDIEAIRYQRVQEISEVDAIAEGCEMDGIFPKDQPHPKCGHVGWDSAIEWYADLFDSINGRGVWERNPMVWVIQFPRYKS